MQMNIFVEPDKHKLIPDQPTIGNTCRWTIAMLLYMVNKLYLSLSTMFIDHSIGQLYEYIRLDDFSPL